MSDTQIADKDKVRAQELHQKILIHAQLVAQNLWEMCSSLKEMRDTKFFYNLGYMHFDDYCREALGMTRQQAHKSKPTLARWRALKASLTKKRRISPVSSRN